MSTLARQLIGESYAGFYADELNSKQPIPADARIVYRGVSQSGVERLAKLMRRKYGINVWVDGTVTTGWKLLVHAGDHDRATRMFKSTVGESSDLVKRIAWLGGATPDSQKWALEIEFRSSRGYLRPRVRRVGPDGYDVDDLYLSDIVDQPSFYTWGEAKAVKEVFLRKYGHVNATLRLVPASTIKARRK